MLSSRDPGSTAYTATSKPLHHQLRHQHHQAQSPRQPCLTVSVCVCRAQDTFVALRRTLHAISCPKPETCWAVGDLGTDILHTLDGGSTWETQTMRPVTWQVGEYRSSRCHAFHIPLRS